MKHKTTNRYNILFTSYCIYIFDGDFSAILSLSLSRWSLLLRSSSFYLCILVFGEMRFSFSWYILHFSVFAQCICLTECLCMSCKRIVSHSRACLMYSPISITQQKSISEFTNEDFRYSCADAISHYCFYSAFVCLIVRMYVSMQLLLLSLLVGLLLLFAVVFIIAPSPSAFRHFCAL